MRIITLWIVVATGCAGTIDSGGTGGSDVDAAVPDPNPTPGTPGSGSGASFACKPRVTAGLISGHHNPGQDCNGSCHNHGFTLGGTMFSAVSGTAAFTGGTVTVIDAANTQIDVVTAQNGNFYTTQAIQFPVTVIASACPDVTPMTAHVAQTDGGCNRSGCHVTGGVGQIHLP